MPKRPREWLGEVEKWRSVGRDEVAIPVPAWLQCTLMLEKNHEVKNLVLDSFFSVFLHKV